MQLGACFHRATRVSFGTHQEGVEAIVQNLADGKRVHHRVETLVD